MKHVLHNCPSCNKELTRVKRTNADHVLNFITLNRHYNKRYYCFACLKSYSFSKHQLDSAELPVFEIKKRDTVKKFALSKPILAILIFSLMGLLIVAGSYISSRNNSNISLNESEVSVSQR